MLRSTLLALLGLVACTWTLRAEDVVAHSLTELAQFARHDDQTITMPAGIYRMTDYLTPDVVEEIKQTVPKGQGRLPVWMINFSGNRNHYELTDVIIEIDTSLYHLLPYGYTRCLFFSGEGNIVQGLTVRNTGENRGSNGNILTVFGDNTKLEDVTLHVRGSNPYGYGDLLGKGGPGYVTLGKQSGFMIGGDHVELLRCRVFSRAFGHCFYIQGAQHARLIDCYAEGSTRSTNEMLRDTFGPAFDHQFRSVYENRDGRYLITPGYIKSLSEDGFRTYGSGGPRKQPTDDVQLINCIARHTRAGFEISGSEDSTNKTRLNNCQAIGCERGYLLGSNVIVRGSRGDISHGPLLYLRGGRDSDIELELADDQPKQTVHALATIAGSHHRVRFYTNMSEMADSLPRRPIMLGYGMPMHAEMATPILPAPTDHITLINELPNASVIRHDDATDCTVESAGPVFTSSEAATGPKGKW